MSRRGWVLFAAMSVIWGVPYLLIKVAVEEVEPSTLVLARTALAAAILLPIAAARGQVRPVLRRWPPLLAFSAIEVCIPWLLLGHAEKRLSSSLTCLLVASVPIIGALLAWLGGNHEPLGARRALGLVLGLAGVGALVGFEVGGGDLGAIVAVAIVSVSYAVGPLILTRYLADLPGLGVIAVSLAVAAVVYLPAGLAQAPGGWPSARATASVVVLALLCTALAFLLFFQLIAEVGPARSVVITYVNPAVAVLLGVALLDEAFTPATAVGFVLILAGSVLATSRPPEPAREPEPQRRGAGVECRSLGQPVPEP